MYELTVLVCSRGPTMPVPGAALERDDGDGDKQPNTQHPERVAGAVAAKAVQECAHEILLESGPRLAGHRHHPGAR